MKLKILVISFGLILSMFSGFVGNEKINKTNELNNSITEVSQAENIITENQVNDNKQTEEIVSEIESNKEENKEIQVKVEVPKTEEIKKSTTVSKETEKTKVEQPKVEEKKTTTKVETPKTETPKKTEVTPSDLEYWCVEGGSHHVAGDGANEHGYYSSWNEAYNAFENYTKGWASVQFKVDCCACGKYYFWAIK